MTASGAATRTHHVHARCAGTLSKATHQNPFCSLQTKRNKKTNNNKFVTINITRTTSSCKTQVSWCLLVPQIRKLHKAQLNKEALVLLLQLSLSCVFFFFGGICFSSQAALDSGACFFENQLPQETHYQEICRFAMDLFWFKKTVLSTLPVGRQAQMTI